MNAINVDIPKINDETEVINTGRKLKLQDVEDVETITGVMWNGFWLVQCMREDCIQV